METTTIEYARKELQAQKKVGQPKWQRITLLGVLGYEAAGFFLCPSQNSFRLDHGWPRFRRTAHLVLD